jgi:hypothetical protein
LTGLGQEVRGQQLRQDAGVDLVGVDLASAIARVLRGLDTTTRATRGRNIVAMASLLVVASSAI